MANEGTTILLAEDDIILAELYTDRLRQEGFTVIHVSNGEDALKAVRETPPHLIILDVMMPKMNGLDVLKALKEDPETNHIPVIIVTALVQEIEKVNKMMNPADAYIVKSEVLPAEIIEEVKRRLEVEESGIPAEPAPTAIAPNSPKASEMEMEPATPRSLPPTPTSPAAEPQLTMPAQPAAKSPQGLPPVPPAA